MEDAQGQQLNTYGRKLARVEFEVGSDSLVVIEDDFIVASVQSPLVSMGGSFEEDGLWNHLDLVSPDKEYKIPSRYMRDSLTLRGSIRAVQLADEDLEPHGLEVIEEETSSSVETANMKIEEFLVVQTVMKIHNELLERLNKRGWTATEAGNPFFIMPETVNFLDPSMVYVWNYWPFR